MILAILSKNGETLKTPKNTDDTVDSRTSMKYFTSEVTPATSNFNLFFSKLNLSLLSDADREDLEADISKSEIKQAIKALARGRTPGDRGFSIRFYFFVISFMGFLWRPNPVLFSLIGCYWPIDIGLFRS